MAHCYSEAAEEILDKEIKVHNLGFVRLVDYMGNDSRIVQSARVSYGKGTKTVREDKGLINYLLKNDHTSPFEQVEFTFHIKAPIFVLRQWLRHRMASVNEISGRYSMLQSEFYLPHPVDIKFQSTDNKQGRSDSKVPEYLKERVIESLCDDQTMIYENYEHLLKFNISKELSRINLPLSTYSELYWKIDLHNLLHFLKLRMDKHAQKEIRDYANVLANIVKLAAPITFEAFEEHILNGVRFSRTEVLAIKELLKCRMPDLDGKALEEFLKKLESVGK